MRIYALSKRNQYLISIGLVSAVVTLGLLFRELAGYRVIAFVLLVSVSALTLFVDIRPVILAAILSALLWDFLFIPPRFTFTVGDTEDRLLLLTYLIVVVIHAVLTHKIKEMQKEVLKRETKANEAKLYNTLFNSLSHELRTPITTIIGATDNLQSGDTRISENEKQELLSEIAIASVRLNQQVENLLSMSRIEAGAFSIKKDWCDIRELVHRSLQRFEPAISKWRVNVFVPDNFPLFKLDVGLMEQVLHNLIGNVIQHTQEGTDITIKADAEEEKLVIEISDTGKGFPETDIHKVFRKFYRVKGSHAGGTGLGLSIVKGFVEAHHGTIQLRNLPLSGAEFRVVIPTEISYLSGLKNE